MNFKLLLIYISILVFQGCSIKNDEQKIKKDYKSHIGKYINFPENLEYLNITHCSDLNNDKIKIVTLLNGNCHKCVETLNNKWFDLFMFNNGEVDFIFVMRTVDNDHFKKLIMPDIIFEPIYILDETDEFMKINNISPNPLFHTFLTDKKNQIQLIGNPISTVSMNDLYEKKIFELTTQNN